MNSAIVASIIRHVLTTAGGGFAVAWGIDGETWQGIVGAIATLGGLGWSIWDKRRV